MKVNKNILFVDFNGVISYLPFWHALLNPKHSLHPKLSIIQETTFKGKDGLVLEWMLGAKTSEEVHAIIEEQTNIPASLLFPIFVNDCKKLDISRPILKLITSLRTQYHTVLITDNMDSFTRFTLPANPILTTSFDLISNSADINTLKSQNSGAIFQNIIQSFGVVTQNCILVDDSTTNIETFQKLGGIGLQTRSESEALKALRI